MTITIEGEPKEIAALEQALKGSSALSIDEINRELAKQLYNSIKLDIKN